MERIGKISSASETNTSYIWINKAQVCAYPSPDTVIGSTSTMVAPVQPSYAQTAPQIKQDYSGYVDNRYGCHSSQYPQQQTLDYQTFDSYIPYFFD
uniref:Uncharacterized protein n=1 Tax=Panagrolaimus sp. PS1159 TaxID=55785 RepID=A0AC35GIQ6_9BILA